MVRIVALAWRVTPTGRFVFYALTETGVVLVRVDEPTADGWVTVSDWLEAAERWERGVDDWVATHRARGARDAVAVTGDAAAALRVALAARAQCHEFAMAAYRREASRFGKPSPLAEALRKE